MRHRLQRIFKFGATVAANPISPAIDSEYPAQCIMVTTKHVLCNSAHELNHELPPWDQLPIAYGFLTQWVNGTVVGRANSYKGDHFEYVAGKGRPPNLRGEYESIFRRFAASTVQIDRGVGFLPPRRSCSLVASTLEP